MSAPSEEPLIAVFVDFENLAIGVRDMKQGKFRIDLILKRLLEKGLIKQDAIDAMAAEIANEVDEAIRQADADPHPPLEDRFNDVLAEKYPYQPK